MSREVNLIYVSLGGRAVVEVKISVGVNVESSTISTRLVKVTGLVQVTVCVINECCKRNNIYYS